MKFVIGDIHGRVKKLNQVFEKSNFDFENNELICLGDLCDRGLHTKDVINLLMNVKNLVLLIGNHDRWFIDWMTHHGDSWYLDMWLKQNGGKHTLDSFKYTKDFTPYVDFYSQAKLYHKDSMNRYFAHANVPFDLTTTDEYDFSWDRSLAYQCEKKQKIGDYYSKFFKIYLGHTIVSNYPLNHHNVWLMDTGAGFDGKLSMMNIETEEIFQSDGKKLI